MFRTGCVFSLALLAALPAMGQSKKMVQGPNRMELTLERYDSKAWRVVDPGTVFNNGDRIRFRFRTNFSGYLYVMNQGTAGSYTQLFPKEDSGLQNRIDAEKEYMVPATQGGSFKVDGPPGQDIVYWLVSPVVMGGEHVHTPLPPPPPANTNPPPSMTPRCDDAILRARGECVDSTAGAKPVARGQDLPQNIQKASPDNSQELVFMKSQNRSIVKSQGRLAGPVVYEYRLAHK